MPNLKEKEVFTAKTPRPPRKTSIWIILVFAFGGMACKGYSFEPPKNGFVPDEKTAVKIAEAVLFPIYGEKLIKSEEPFVIRLRKGVWFIDGKALPKLMNGGVVRLQISKKDARVLYVIHEQ